MVSLNACALSTKLKLLPPLPPVSKFCRDDIILYAKKNILFDFYPTLFFLIISTNIANVNRKLTHTKIREEYIYGYNSCNIKSTTGFNTIFISDFISSRFIVATHSFTKFSLNI